MNNTAQSNTDEVVVGGGHRSRVFQCQRSGGSSGRSLLLKMHAMVVILYGCMIMLSHMRVNIGVACMDTNQYRSTLEFPYEINGIET